MIPMDTDKALRQRFAPRTGDTHLYLLRDSSRDSDSHTPTEGRPNSGVGPIQVVSPQRAPVTGVPMYDATHDATHDATLDPMADAVDGDGLSAARGILLGSVLGIGFWSTVAGLIGMFAF